MNESLYNFLFFCGVCLFILLMAFVVSGIVGIFMYFTDRVFCKKCGGRLYRKLKNVNYVSSGHGFNYETTNIFVCENCRRRIVIKSPKFNEKY